MSISSLAFAEFRIFRVKTKKSNINFPGLFRGTVSLEIRSNESFNELSGLFSISTEITWNSKRSKVTGVSTPLAGSSHFYMNFWMITRFDLLCVNALNGLFSFLRYPLGTRINTGFADSFLQVFIWQFWKQAIFTHFLAC